MGPTMRKNGLFAHISAAREGMSRRLGRLLAAGAAVAAFAGHVDAQVYGFSVLAGDPAALDHTDGTGTNARFFNPSAVAVDSAGNIYVADGGDHAIRKVTPGGVVTTFAGNSGQPGSSDGSGSGALFLYPYAVAVDAAGNVYVADSGNQNIRKITPGGVVTTLAGTAGVAGSADGTGVAALFNLPQGIAVDAAGNVYVCDTNSCTIRKMTAAGVVTTLAGVAGQNGSADGAGSSARFDYPVGLAVDSSGNIYVADLDNSTIRFVTPGGAVSTLAGSAGNAGSVDGQGASARFNHPAAVAVDGSANVYVIDTSNQTIREISPAGSVSTLAGTPGTGGNADGTGAAARFFYPGGIASTGSGTVYVADTGNHTIRAMDSPGVVSTLAGAAGTKGSADGVGIHAQFAYPYGVASDGSGNLYVADSNNNTIRMVTAAGAVTTIAGTAGILGSAEGVGANASFSSPSGVAADAGGNLYVADTGNSVIRKIAPDGTVTAFAGLAGVAGSSDGTGTGARFSSPSGVAVDDVGNLYVADTNNNTVRKITAGGTVTTLAGVAGQSGSGDGTGGSARFHGPLAVSVDGSGNVYVADFFNATIRKIDLSGTVSTLAGLAGMLGFTDGTGAAARFNQPYGLTVDGSGNLFVADTYNRAIRKVTPGGSVTTLNGPQTRFYYPQGIALDASGNLYVADGDNQAINLGAAIVAPPAGTQVSSQSVALGQNASFTIAASGSFMTYQWRTSVDAGATWTNVENNSLFSGSTTATLTIAAPSVLMSGDLFQVELANPAGSSLSGSGTLTVSGPTPTPTPTPTQGSPQTAHLTNLSVRSNAGSGSQTLIGGFVIGGTGNESILLRGDGPALAAFGVTGVLPDPVLTLFNSASVQIATNSGWGGTAALSSAFAQVGAFAFQAGSKDAALLTSLGSGGFTAQISSTSGDSGVVLVEVYDADTGTPTAHFANLSARSEAGTGSQTLIAGFSVSGAGTETVLIRADGPGLTAFGVTGVLASPQLTLFDSNGIAMATNAGWSNASTLGVSPVQATVTAATTAVFGQVGAFDLTAGSADSAMVVALPPGSYTAQVIGANNSTGVALVEVYEVP